MFCNRYVRKPRELLHIVRLRKVSIHHRILLLPAFFVDFYHQIIPTRVSSIRFPYEKGALIKLWLKLFIAYMRAIIFVNYLDNDTPTQLFDTTLTYLQDMRLDL